MKKVLFLAIVIIFCLATTIMASPRYVEHFTAILPSWGGDVDCLVRAKGTDDPSNSIVKIDSGSDSVNFWLMKQEGGIRLGRKIYIQSANYDKWFNLPYSEATISPGQMMILRADGANPSSGVVSGEFDAK